MRANCKLMIIGKDINAVKKCISVKFKYWKMYFYVELKNLTNYSERNITINMSFS